MTTFRPALLGAVVLALGAGCKPGGRLSGPADTSKSLAEARAGFATKLARQHRADEPVDEPPAAVFRKVKYDAPVGKCAAYLTPDPKDGRKHPAVVWITGGDCNTIGEMWKPKPRGDDQTARQYREAGVVMMVPSLRGGNDNPGVQENFLGEVDDVLAAAAHLAKQDYVDPKRVYLGGHSTGGTLALLVAEVPNPFRAVVSFGPVDDISGYPADVRPAVNVGDRREVELRSPGRWLHSIQCPTFVFEGTDGGNIDSLRAMQGRTTSAKFFAVKGASHFSILAPVNELVARKIAADTGEGATKLSFTEDELNGLFRN
jgi:dipeptidyl aminopeptidase/acylaminoacyl peptidase